MAVQRLHRVTCIGKNNLILLIFGHFHWDA